MSSPCFTMQAEFSIVSLQEDHSVSQSLRPPEVSRDHLFSCFFQRFSLGARKGVTHLRERIPGEICPVKSGAVPHIGVPASLLPSFVRGGSRANLGEDLFVLPPRPCLSPSGTKIVNDAGARHSFLSVMCVNQGGV